MTIPMHSMLPSRDGNTANVRCPICGQPTELIFGGQGWFLHEDEPIYCYAECKRCELVFSDPMPSNETIARLYGECYDYTWFLRRKYLKQLQAWHRYRRLRMQLKDLVGNDSNRGRMLDIGCGHGWFLGAASHDGWKTEGLELLSGEHTVPENVTIHEGGPLRHQLPHRSYDIITMWHVLEHMNQPREALVAVAELLKPGGICVIAVPNYYAAGFQHRRERWVWCQPPYVHPWHFTASSLKAILPQVFEPISVTSRDTWDAQWYESTLLHRGLMFGGNRMWGALENSARRIGLDRLSRWLEFGQFLYQETERLVGYAGYLATRPFLRHSYEEALRGSELMLICRKQES